MVNNRYTQSIWWVHGNCKCSSNECCYYFQMAGRRGKSFGYRLLQQSSCNFLLPSYILRRKRGSIIGSLCIAVTVYQKNNREPYSGQSFGHPPAASHSYRLVPKMVLTMCKLCWWCFYFHQLAQILHWHSVRV